MGRRVGVAGPVPPHAESCPETTLYPSPNRESPIAPCTHVVTRLVAPLVVNSRIDSWGRMSAELSSRKLGWSVR